MHYPNVLYKRPDILYKYMFCTASLDISVAKGIVDATILAILIGLSQICSKICPKCFWEISPIMLRLLPIMLTVIIAVRYVYTHNLYN